MITLLDERSGIAVERNRSMTPLDSAPTGTQKGKTGGQGAYGASYATKWN
jgi:hypothetical protein